MSVALRIQVLTAIGVVASTSACWQYRAVQSQCPPAQFSPTTFLFTAERTASGEVRGRVVHSDSGTPIPMASVEFVGVPGSGGYTRDDGSFALRTDSLGQYTLYVRRIGYVPAHGKLVVDSTLQPSPLDVPIAPGTTTLDGCGYVQFRERRPWWQWWYPPAV